MTHLRYWQARARGNPGDKAMDVSALPGGGDLVTFAHAVWQGLPADGLMDRKNRLYVEPVSVEPAGRTVMFEANVGRYGDPASLRDAETRREELQHDGRLAHTVPVRALLAVPLHGRSAILLTEHAAEGQLGQALVKAMKLAWQQSYPGWTLDRETLTRSDAWLESAKLTEVTATIHGHSSDLADAGVPRRLGKIRSTLSPEKSGWLPRDLLPRLLDKSLSRGQLLGLSTEPDEVTVRLSDGEQTKSFVIDQDPKTPPVRYLVTDHGQPTQATPVFRQWCTRELRDIFRPLGTEWDTSWNTGDWSDQDLAQRVVVDGVREDSY